MPYESHVTTSPVFDKPAHITYPFASQGDIVTKIVHQPLLQLADRYEPPTIGGVFSSGLANLSGSPVTIGSAYCVGDTEPQPAEAGLVSFTRMWANIPAPRLIPSGTTLYQFVGLPSGISGSPKTVTAMSSTANSLTLTSAAHGYSLGDQIMLKVRFTVGARGYSLIYLSPITAVTTDTITFTRGVLSTGTIVFVSGTVTKQQSYRKTFQAKSSTMTQFEYVLPGVTSGVSDASDYLPLLPFAPVLASTGQSIADYADLENTLTAFTNPTDAEYRSLITEGSLLIAESDIALWKGPILERKTLLVRAM